jgi:hypothetical protein
MAHSLHSNRPIVFAPTWQLQSTDPHPLQPNSDRGDAKKIYTFEDNPNIYWVLKLPANKFSGILLLFCDLPIPKCANQGATKRCRLSWLTNSALVYSPNAGGGGEFAESQPMSTAVHNAHGAQINFGDITPYLTYGANLQYVAGGCKVIL